MLDKLLQIDLIEKVIINTDAADLIKLDEFANPEQIVVKVRKPNLCGNDVSMNRIIEDDICHEVADFYLMTHTTNPLLRISTIVNAIKIFNEAITTQKIDSLFTVNRFQSRFYDKSTNPINHDPSNLIPTQSLEPFYEENSNLYLFTKESFFQTKARIGQLPIMFEIPKLESIDIDVQEDWDLAELIANNQGIYNS